MGKEVVIVGSGGSGAKSYLASLMAMSAMHSSSYLNDSEPLPKATPVRNVPQLMPKKEQGRNEPCKCGSGLKYKKCCGK